MCLHVVSVVTVDQQLHTGVLILPDQIDRLGHCPNKTPQRSASCQPLALSRYSSIVPAEQPAVIVRRFNLGVVTLRGITMAAEHRKLVPHHFRITDDVAGIGQASDRTKRKLFATTSD